MATQKEQLAKLVADMKALGDEIDARGDGLAAEEQVTLTKMANDVNVLVESIKATATASGTVDMASAFLADLAEAPVTEKAAPVVIDGIVDPQGMTLGEAFAKSTVFDEFVKQFKGNDGQIRNDNNVKSAGYNLPGFHAKDLVTGGSDTSGGAFVRPDRLPGIVDLAPDRELTIRSLCTNITTSSDTFEYVRVTSKTRNAAGVLEATSSAPIDGTTVTDAIGGLKPESAIAFEVVSSPVETIAHWMAISRRAAADGGHIAGLINQFLLSDLGRAEEDAILTGSGNSPELKGLLSYALPTVPSAGTDLDAVVDAQAKIRLAGRIPTAIVMHPNDWFSPGFMTAKASDGQYLITDPRASLDQLLRVWGLQVVLSNAMTENTALVGDFRQAVVADREQASIYVTDSHADFFTRNILAILAEERLGFGVLDTSAFCTITAV